MKCSMIKFLDEMIDLSAEENEQYDIEIQQRPNGKTILYVHVNGVTKLRLIAPTEKVEIIGA